MTSGSFFGFLDNTNQPSLPKQEVNYVDLFEKLKNQAHHEIVELPEDLKFCKHFWKHAIFYSPKDNLKVLPRRFKEDAVFWQNILTENPDLLEYCPQSICENHTLVSYALSQDPTVIRFASKVAVIEILKMDASFSHYLPDALKDDEEIILASVKRKGLNLQYASDRLKNHEEVVRCAITSCGLALQYAHKDFRMNEEFVMLAARQNPQALAFMHSELKSKQDFILRLLKSTTLALKYANFLQDHEIFIQKAVTINGLCLEHVSERLRNKEDVVRAAIFQNPKALRFASSRLKDDEQIVFEAVSKNGLCLAFASKRLKGFESIVYKAVQQNGMALQYADSELKKIKEIVIPACRKDGRALVYAHPQLKKIRSVVLSAVNQNGLALKHAFKDLKKYKEIVMMALSQNGGAIRYASSEFSCVDFYVEFAVLSNPRALNHVHKRFMNQKDVMKKVLKRDPYLFDKIDPILKINKEFLKEIIRENHLIFDRICLEIKKDHKFIEEMGALKVLSTDQKLKLLSLTDEEVKFSLIAKVIEAFNFGKLEVNALNKEVYGLCISSINTKSLPDLMHQIALRTWGPSSLCDFTTESKAKMLELQKTSIEDLIVEDLEGLYFAFIAKIERFNASRAKKFDVYHACITSCKAHIKDMLTIVPALWQLCGYDKLVQIGLHNYQSLKLFLLDPILKQSFFSEEDLDQFIDGLAKMRLPQAVFAYAYSFAHDLCMKEPFKHLLNLISGRVLLSDIKNIHLIEHEGLSDDQKNMWQTYDFSSYEVEPIDLRSYFKSHLIKVDFEEQQETLLATKLTLDIFKQSLLDKASSFSLCDHPLESVLLSLIDAKACDKLTLIDKAISLIKEQGFLDSDIYHLLINLKNKLECLYFLDVSSNWQDLFLCGTEVGGSSQRASGDPQFNRCLLSYVFNPRVKVICLKSHSGGSIKARAILKLMYEDNAEGKKPCLLMERFYPRAISKEHETMLLEKAKDVARRLKLELFMIKPEKKKDILFQALSASGQKQEVKKLLSIGPVPLCPFEYSDVGYGVTCGSYAINALKVELN
jgi:Domain of unknown function (DUF4116)